MTRHDLLVPITARQRRPTEVVSPTPTGWPAVVPHHAPPDVVPAIDECGEPLVAVDDVVPCLNLYRVDGWAGTEPTTWLRANVASRLVAAHRSLPDGFGLAVFDGWRSPTTCRALFDHFYGPDSTLPPGYVADPDDADWPPPHSTGGAVDLTLTWRGQGLALGTAFDDFSPAAAADALEGPAGAEPDRSLRRMLAGVLEGQGFVGLAEEWWHVSWGDQHWAACTGEASARYGPTSPAD